MATQGLRGETSLADQFSIDFGRPIAGAGGGLPAFAAIDLQGGGVPMVAIQVRPDWPPLPGPLNRLAGPAGAIPVTSVMTPLAHGTYAGGGTQESYYVLCQAPPGPPVTAGGPITPWSEADLTDSLLIPMAAALDRLQTIGVTHRSIRPDNLFRSGAGAEVTLGCGWATPPGLLQPAIYQPPYAAMCIPGGQGGGSIGDDIYALGVTLLTLATGRVPLEGVDPEEIIRRKLDLGCFGAMTAQTKVTPLIADLLRGMLAEDPDHRTPAAALTDPLTARGRRPAGRPTRRALRAIEMGGVAQWNARMVAHAIARFPDLGAKMLRAGDIDRWLRLHLGDIGLATRVDEIARQKGGKEDNRTDAATQALLDTRTDGLVAMRAVAAFDPLAPLCWRGTALWPDTMGPALAMAHAVSHPAGPVGAPGPAVQAPGPALLTPAVAGAIVAHIEEIIGGEVVARWADLRPARCDAALLRMDGRQHRLWQRQRGPGGGLNRLLYGLNPLLRCPSPLLAGRYVASAAALLPALEAVSVRPDVRRAPPMDQQIAVFIAARVDSPVNPEAAPVTDPIAAALQPLRLLAGLQTRLRPPPLPGLAGWLVPHVSMAVDSWHSRTRRTLVADRLAVLAKQGDLAGMVTLLDDREAREADTAGLARATAELEQIDARVAHLGAAMEGRTEDARRVGQEICVGIGLVALVISVGMVVL